MELKDLTQTPFLTFTYHVKLDKKGNVIDGKYGEFDIQFFLPIT